jgi:hypothetical protein
MILGLNSQILASIPQSYWQRCTRHTERYKVERLNLSCKVSDRVKLKLCPSLPTPCQLFKGEGPTLTSPSEVHLPAAIVPMNVPKATGTDLVKPPIPRNVAPKGKAALKRGPSQDPMNLINAALQRVYRDHKIKMPKTSQEWEVVPFGGGELVDHYFDFAFLPSLPNSFLRNWSSSYYQATLGKMEIVRHRTRVLSTNQWTIKENVFLTQGSQETGVNRCSQGGRIGLHQI